MFPHLVGRERSLRPRPAWGFNGDMDRPTLTPSINASREYRDPTNRPDRRCHSFVTAGRIQFLADCTHALAGQTVDLPDLLGVV